MARATLTLQSEFEISVTGPISRGCRTTRDNPGEPPSAEVRYVRIGDKELTEQQMELLDTICDDWGKLAEAALLDQAPTAADVADDTLAEKRGEA